MAGPQFPQEPFPPSGLNFLTVRELGALQFWVDTDIVRKNMIESMFCIEKVTNRVVQQKWLFKSGSAQKWDVLKLQPAVGGNEVKENAA